MKKIQQQAISHYNRMIKWVKTQDPKQYPDECFMEQEIGEDWFGDGCPYCKINMAEEYDEKHAECEKCPLSKNGAEQGIGTGNCCNGLWKKMARSKTWKTWLKYAELIKQYIIEKG
jgi:hypothetical protein